MKRKNKGNYVGVLSSVFAIVIGLLVGLVVLILCNPAQAFPGFFTILTGAFTHGMKGVGQVFYYATPIILTGLSVGFAFKTGVFNIGTPGQFIMGADSHTCTYGALGAFSTGVGSTDMAAGMATGKAWFKVPSAIKVVLTGKMDRWVSGKDVILHLIGSIGVDGALYRSLEFTGEGVAELSMDDRFTIANMAIEAGAKNGIFPVDDKTIAYMKEHSKKEYTIYEADEDAVYDETITIDLGALDPTVAFPHLPENTKTVKESGDVAIDQVVIGSCTNGRIEDMRVAAKILEGRKVKKGIRCIVIPATQDIYLQAIEEGLTQIFVKAGAIVSTPTCGPCLGGYMGILAAGERAVSTTNRNFVGRMGHVDSEVYLASPAVAAASAVTGKISEPAELGL